MHNKYGFGLVELMSVVAIIAIFIAVAVPNFSTSAERSKIKSAKRSLLSELAFARSEAVKRQQTVSICASSSGQHCDTANWARGRLVFVDDGAGNNANAANGAFDNETVVKSYGSIEEGLIVTASDFESVGVIVFSKDGSIAQAGSLTICSERDDIKPDAVNVNIIGRPQGAYDSDSDEAGLVNNVTGGNVSCS